MPELREMLEAALKRADAATPGPWMFESCSLTNWHDNSFDMEWIPNIFYGKAGPDGGFMAAARAQHPALVKFALAVMDSKNAVYLTEIQRAIAELAATLGAE